MPTKRTSTHVLPGYGGHWECTVYPEGHSGYSPKAMGIPDKCIVMNCGAPTRRFDEGSTKANQLLEELRAERRAKAAPLRGKQDPPSA